MDHLTSSEERRARWYSKLEPRFVAVQPATDWDDLLSLPKEHEGSDHVLYTDMVKSVPMQWLLQRDDGDDDIHRMRIVHSKLNQALQHHGFLIISNVLSTSECQDALHLALDWVDAVSVAIEERSSSQPHESMIHDAGVGPNNSRQYGPPPENVNVKRFPKSIEGGIIPFFGSGQSSFAWKIRSHPNVIRVFQCIWSGNGSDDGKSDSSMIVSMDGIVLWQSQHPPTDAGWFHVDQNPINKPGFECVQGLVNLLPVTPTTGGNALVPQSHRLFPHHYTGERVGEDLIHIHSCLQFYQDRLAELNGDDWMEIDPNDTTVLVPNNIISCLLGPGDLLVWDSRLVHCSYPGKNQGSKRTEKANVPIADNYELCRAATIVSMMPESKCTLQVLEQRRQAVNAARTLTHWANKVAPLGNEHTTDKSAQEEAEVVTIMKRHQAATGTKILLEFNDLTATQQRLVVGDLNLC